MTPLLPSINEYVVHLSSLKTPGLHSLPFLFAGLHPTARRTGVTRAWRQSSKTHVYKRWSSHCPPRHSSRYLHVSPTANQLHRDMPRVYTQVARKALAAGKHVLQEKPIGATMQEAVDLLTLYNKEYSKRLMWGVAEN